MKKFFMIAAMAVAALTANAQDSQDYKKFHITPHAGLGYMNISDPYLSKGDAVAGQVGVDFEFMATKDLGISAGLNYNYAQTLNEKLSKFDSKYVSWDIDTYNKYSIGSIPVMAQYHFGRFAVKAGVQADFMLDAKNVWTGSTSIDDKDAHAWIPGYADSSIKDAYKTVAMSIPVGVSYSFKVPVTIDLRANIPVTKFSKEDFGNQKFMPVMLTVGYRF